MGLDITAYANLKAVGKRTGTDDDYDGDNITLYDNTDFPGRCAPIDCEMLYTGDECDICFGLSYSGYNRFRDWIDAKFKGEEDAQLIVNFADNEGTIGTDACKKLAALFATKQHLKADEEWGYHFNNLFAMLTFASNGGCLDFH